MSFRHLPIRWRLTLWYAGLLALVLLLFGAGLYFGLRWRLYHTFDEQLQAQAAATLINVRTETGTLALASTDPSGQAQDEYFVRLLDINGRVVADISQAMGGAPLDERIVTAALTGKTSLSSARIEGDTLRIVTTPVLREGAIAGVLQVGLFRDEIDETLTELLGALALALPLALLVSAGGGYLLAGRALAPVAAITGLAARIGEHDLDARLNLDLPNDELGRLARTFDAMLARIADAFARQRRFTGDSAHELRTPLSLMRSQVDHALARPRTVAEYREALRGLDGDLARLTDLVASLLTLARADTGLLGTERTTFDLAGTVELVVEQYAPLAAEAGITLSSEATSAPLMADEDQLVQVLVNLVDNALAHTPSGGRISAGCQVDAPSIRLWVTDSGTGIAPEHHSRVFDRFYRVDSGRTRAAGGTGLGLAICRAIAEAHGGSIALTSTPSHGTTVELRLPDGSGAIL